MFLVLAAQYSYCDSSSASHPACCFLPVWRHKAGSSAHIHCQTAPFQMTSAALKNGKILTGEMNLSEGRRAWTNLLRRLTQPPAEDLIKPRTATLGLGCQVRDRKQSNIKCRCLFAVIMTFPCACTNSEANDLCQALRLMRWQTISTLWLAVGLGNGEQPRRREWHAYGADTVENLFIWMLIEE